MNRVLLVASLIIGVSLTPLACHNPPLPVIDVVECASQDQSKIAAELIKLSALIPGWSLILATATTDVAAIGWEIVGCVFSDLTQQYLLKKGASITEDESYAAHDAFEIWRAQSGHGASFKIGKQALTKAPKP